MITNQKALRAAFWAANPELLGKPISGAEMIELNYDSVPPNHESFSSLQEANEYREKMLAAIQ